ncbi:hypothetical protein DEO72_LG8g1990 [Vigna unguiculata]|uniref:Uncharacterized protein n=1 Tax=Vigna unguiculata TaxID=3917 RepID=A0A4D6MSA5_VIGUN|nr:hypothetical protein DEO72_LG8g1990 [Vigna unguiculata]
MAVAGETVARPVNLAQASQSCLGETIRDLPKLLLRERSPKRPAQRGGGTRLSETVSPERGAGRDSAMWDVFLVLYGYNAGLVLSICTKGLVRLSGARFSGRDVIPWPLLVGVHGGAPSV